MNNPFFSHITCEGSTRLGNITSKICFISYFIVTSLQILTLFVIVKLQILFTLTLISQRIAFGISQWFNIHFQGTSEDLPFGLPL